MKARELIEILKQDPDAQVQVWDPKNDVLTGCVQVERQDDGSLLITNV